MLLVVRAPKGEVFSLLKKEGLKVRALYMIMPVQKSVEHRLHGVADDDTLQ